MKEESIKKWLKEANESPSSDFSKRVMHSIDTLETRSAPETIGASSSVIYLVPVLFVIILIISVISLRSFDITFPDLEMPSVNLPDLKINPLWVFSTLFICSGLWVWLWYEKRYYYKED